HVLRFDELAVEGLRERQTVVGAQFCRRLVDGAQVVGDHAGVSGGVFNGLQRQVAAGFVAQTVVRLQVVQHRRVVVGVHHNTHVRAVLGGRADHGGATDVDVFNRQWPVGIRLGHGGGERIQIHHHQINGVDAVFSHHIIVLTTTTQYTTVNFRVQGFYPAIHHFREAGVVRHFYGGNLIVDQQLISTAGGQDFHAGGVQSLGEVDDTGFVGHADQGAAYRSNINRF